jgi:peptide/nickel transport system permease protein
LTDPSRTPAAPPAEDPTWAEIVWGQFRKRRVAYGAMWGVLALFLLAVYVPVFVANRPFLWIGDKGVELPWLVTLFDRNVYPSGIDLFFNSLLVFGTLVAIPAAWAWRRAAPLPRRDRAASRKRAVTAAMGAWLVATTAVSVADIKRPVRYYADEAARLEAAGTPPTAIWPLVRISPNDTDLSKTMAEPSAEHLLGTDSAGSDVFTRMLYGTRVSLTVGVFAVALYISFGTAVGAIAGFFGGRMDAILMRIVEVVICIPSLFLVLAVAAFIPERSIFHIMFIIAAVAWTGPARLVRAEFLRLRDLDFVAAARAAGFSRGHIIFREILPNAIGPVLVSATFGVASAILLESTMSFLGLGDASVPSWGGILAAGRQNNSWVLILAPGFAIFLTVSLLNLLGEGARDALDPKLRS